MSPRPSPQRHWCLLHLGLGLAWCAVLASNAPGSPEPGANAPQVFVMLLLAGWLPSLALASWQVRHRHWLSLIASDLLSAGALVVVSCTAYLPLFFFNVVWFLPMALLPRGVLTELLARRLAGPRALGMGAQTPPQKRAIQVGQRVGLDPD